MNKQRHINSLLTKSYSLCLIFASVGCIPATTPPSTLIDTSAGTLTETTSPSLSVYIPIEILQSNEIRNGLLIGECERSFSSIFDSAHPLAIDGKEQTDELFTLPNHPNQLQHDSLIMGLHEFPANVKIEKSIVTVYELPSGQYLFASNCLTNPLRNSDSGPSSLPNSGGGGGGGRRRTNQGKL